LAFVGSRLSARRALSLVVTAGDTAVANDLLERTDRRMHGHRNS